MSVTNYLTPHLSLHPSYGAAKLSRYLSRCRKTVPAWVPASYGAAELSRRLSRHILVNPRRCNITQLRLGTLLGQRRRPHHRICKPNRQSVSVTHNTPWWLTCPFNPQSLGQHLTGLTTADWMSVYVTPKSPRVAQKVIFCLFLNKIKLQSNKVCYKVFLCENFQQHSRSTTVPISNGP